MYNKLIILIITIAVGFSIWGVHTAYQERNEIKFSKDADIYDTPDLQEIYAVDSLADRGVKTRYEIKYIAIHCSASQSNRPLTKVELDRIFRERGWVVNGKVVWGYHFVINPLGDVLSSVNNLQPNYITSSQIRYGVKNFNSSTINICWSGGYRGDDGRTPQQKSKLIELITQMKKLYPKAVVKSHYQFKGVNKTCANFDAYEEYKNIK